MIKSKPTVVRRARVPAEGLFCNYIHRDCMQPRIDGFEYCIRHILEDKNAPFKQCNFVNKTGRRCSTAAPKLDKKEGYCHHHLRKAALIRQKSNKKQKPKETPETLLESLDDYGRKIENKDKRKNESYTSRLLEYESSSDSDSQHKLIDQAWQGDIDSDPESIDSENEDPLKHAGVYTAEEVAQITRDKLIRLQSLYIEQFKRLQHVLKEKRRKYLHSIHREKGALANLNVTKSDPEQREYYEKLTALKRYHKRFGKEALMHRQSKERRIAATEGANYKPPTYQKCILVKKGIRCNKRTVPLSKYCTNHILFDTHQVLYQRCHYGDGICKRPIAVSVQSEVPLCMYHIQLIVTQQHFPTAEDSLDENKDIDVVGEDDFKLGLEVQSICLRDVSTPHLNDLPSLQEVSNSFSDNKEEVSLELPDIIMEDEADDVAIT